MAICIECGGLYSGRRLKLGYKVCLDCGDQSAQKDKEVKAQCSAPLFNKGPYGYIATKGDAKDAGK